MKEGTHSSENKQIVDFEVKNEEWNVYELEDETILKAKILLIFVVKKGEKNGRMNASLSTNFVSGVFSPKERGPKGRKYSIRELKENVIQSNLKFRQLEDGGWNEYETEKGIIQVRVTLKSVDKTSLFDSAGMPSYVVNYETDIITKPKDTDGQQQHL